MIGDLIVGRWSSPVLVSLDQSPHVGSYRRRTLVFLRLFYEDSPVPGCSSTVQIAPNRLLAPLMGFSQRPPLRRYQPVCPLLLPGFESATPEHVPPLPFFPAATGFSTQAFVDLLHSTTDHEVHLDFEQIADIRRLLTVHPMLVSRRSIPLRLCSCFQACFRFRILHIRSPLLI